MIARILGFFFIAFLALLSTRQLSAQQPAINCQRAATSDEIAICSSSRLARLDRQLQGLFNTLQATLNPHDQALLRETERRWLVTRSGCGSEESCIASQYQSRIVQLSAMLSGSSPAPIPSQPSNPTSPPNGPRSPDGKKDACDAFPTLC
jgi:uncharacterized protein